jgi:hypothetical protein
MFSDCFDIILDAIAFYELLFNSCMGGISPPSVITQTQRFLHRCSQEFLATHQHPQFPYQRAFGR